MPEKILYFEDFTEGQRFASGSYAIDLDRAVAFAKEYDPQYFHTDVEAAKKSVFGKLAASGFYTAAISMRLKISTDLSKMAGGLIGLGMESMTWPRPVYPGDTLHLIVTIISKRLSQSNPKHGIIQYKMQTFNQNNELVMEASPTVIAPCRPQAL